MAFRHTRFLPKPRLVWEGELPLNKQHVALGARGAHRSARRKHAAPGHHCKGAEPPSQVMGNW